MRFRDDDNGTKNPTALLGPDSVGLANEIYACIRSVQRTEQ